jgi:hypothetical protein
VLRLDDSRSEHDIGDDGHASILLEFLR